VTGTTREQAAPVLSGTTWRLEIYINQRFGTLLDPVERDIRIAAWIRELRAPRADHRAVSACGTEILIQSTAAASGRASPPAPTSVGRCA
jgi:hypothetical protein